MTFEECISNLHEGSVVTFKEYTYDRHERKKLSMSIEDCVVQEVLPANTTISREILEKYYGEGLSDVDYMQLSNMSCPRLVMNLGINIHQEIDVKILILNKDFYNTGLQEITITNEINPHNFVEPNYVLSQGGW